MRRPLPEKPCARCGRPFAWRKKWRRDWDDVRYCSARCREEARSSRRADRTACSGATGADRMGEG